MSHLISTQSVSKTFGAKPLFENVTLTISDGERLGLIGPNGRASRRCSRSSPG